MKPNDFDGPIQQLVEQARSGDQSARERLQQELERWVSPIVRRWLRTRRNRTPLERRLTRLFGALRDRSDTRPEFDGEAIVALLAKRIGGIVSRRLLRGNVVTDTVPDQPRASVCA